MSKAQPAQLTPAAAVELRQLVLDVQKAHSTGDHEKALKAAMKVLSKFPKETWAQRARIISLIQMGKFDEALTLMAKLHKNEIGDVAFEKAYCYYRTSKNDECLAALNECDANDPRALELRAQLFYRTERFGESGAIFKQLLKNNSDEWDEERRANFLAAQAQEAATSTKSSAAAAQARPDAKQLSTYDQLFNAATHDLATGHPDDALKKLDKAKKLCRETLEEDELTEEEIADELTSIDVQRAYALQQLGRTRDALAIYERLEKEKPSDAAIVAVLLNNLAAARERTPNALAVTRRHLKAALATEPGKLTSRQKRTLLQNQALVLLLSNQREQCRQALQQLKTEYPSATRDATLIESALLAQQGDWKSAVAALQDPSFSEDQEIKLIQLHLLVNHGRFAEALTALDGLPASLKAKSGLTGLRLSLLEADGRTKEALQETEKVLEKAGSSSDAASTQKALLNHTANVAAQIGDNKRAADALEKLSKLTPDDATVKFRLLQALSGFDAKKAKELSGSLFPEEKVDAAYTDQLEESDWLLYGQKYAQKKEGRRGGDGATAQTPGHEEIVTGKLKKTIRKRKRKLRLPKNYNPNVAPDPERWLPKSERAAFRKKLGKKYRDKEVGRGTQGAASGAPPESTPPTNITPASPKSPAKESPLAGEGPRKQGAGAATAKKKRK